MFKRRFILNFLICILQLSVGKYFPNESEVAEHLYIELFKKQRAEHLEAIKNFKRVINDEKQHSMIMIMAEKIFSVMQESRATIEASPYIPGVSEFPLDEKIRDALSNILENTALFSELTLRFPDIVESVLRTNNNWDLVLQWGIAFSHQVKYLLDNSTIRLLHLVSQELNHRERHSDYVNPYRKTKYVKDTVGEQKTQKKKKKSIKKGPRLSSHYEL